MDATTCHDGGPHVFDSRLDDRWNDEKTYVTAMMCSKCNDARRYKMYKWGGEYEYSGSGSCGHNWSVENGEPSDGDWLFTATCIHCDVRRSKRYSHVHVMITDGGGGLLR